MENASKALIMAASMLIGILIISLAVYLFTTFGAQAAQVRSENATQQIRHFNEQFTIYQEQSGKNTIYDVVTAANLANDNNVYYGFIAKNASGKYIETNQPKIELGKDNYISVKLGEKPIENNNNNDDLIKQYIKMNDSIKFKCTVKISDITGRVYLVTFTGK